MAKFRNKANKKVVEVHSKNIIEKFKKDSRYEEIKEKETSQENKPKTSK